MYIRLISLSDYEEFMNLINEFRPTFLSRNEFRYVLKNIYQYGKVWLLIDDLTKEIIGTSTLILEQKIIHNGGWVARIEDFVIKKSHQGKGCGHFLLNELIKKAKETEDCYKIILNCSPELEKFYEKSGFSKHNSEMEIRF